MVGPVPRGNLKLVPVGGHEPGEGVADHHEVEGGAHFPLPPPPTMKLQLVLSH